jgi:Zn-finger protein
MKDRQNTVFCHCPKYTDTEKRELTIATDSYANKKHLRLGYLEAN